jgi:uncharacterized 2Fe-2S/4Fe-4S cluster protein (DUF4445 family)
VSSVRVRFDPDGIEVDVESGTSLHEAAAIAGVLVEAPCGGLARCGGCRVVASGGLSRVKPEESEVLGPRALADGWRLACRARAQGPEPVVVERRGADETAIRVVEHGLSGAVSVQRPADRGLGCAGAPVTLGAVVDLGTTTIVAALADLETGTEIASASSLNPQVASGHDVLSRVSRALEGHAEELRRAAGDEVERLLLGLVADAGAEAGHVCEIVVVGNTAMVHLLLGLDVTPMAGAPYEGASLEARTMPASEAGLAAFGRTRLYVPPAVSAFVGADITAGLVATSLATRTDPTLFIDLGTNGEIALRASGGVLACSTAAGPALEGMSIERGMRAEPGAIERVEVSGSSLILGTIGSAPARGICGSGLLDLVAVLVVRGLVDRSGRMVPLDGDALSRRFREVDEVRRFVLDEVTDVYLTQKDVRQLQLAKGAVAAGIEVLLETAGIGPEDVAEVVIAGGFGLHVRPGSLVALGLVPPVWHDRITFAGNTAEAGGLLMLLDGARRTEAEALAGRVRTVPLATRPDFQDRFVRNLAFPQAIA